MKPIRKVLFMTGFLLGLVFNSVAQNILENKVYRVTAYKNGNTTVTSTSNYAEILPPLHLYIPSAFSPNGDGLNDSFGVKGEGVKNYRLLIFNRWGEVIFESTNPKLEWDGRYAGNKVEQGTYVYQLFALGTGNSGKTGSVTVVY